MQVTQQSPSEYDKLVATYHAKVKSITASLVAAQSGESEYQFEAIQSAFSDMHKLCAAVVETSG